MAPRADKDKSKRRPAPRASRSKPPAGSGRPTRPSGGVRRKPPARLNIRDAAAEAAARRAAEKQETSDAADDFEDARTSPTGSETNGQGQRPDDTAQTDSGDSWDEGGGDGPGKGVNRTLGELLEAVVPPEAQLHFLLAGREFAAGIQTTLDYHLHRDGGGDDGEGAGALRIDIE